MTSKKDTSLLLSSSPSPAYFPPFLFFFPTLCFQEHFSDSSLDWLRWWKSLIPQTMSFIEAIYSSKLKQDRVHAAQLVWFGNIHIIIHSYEPKHGGPSKPPSWNSPCLSPMLTFKLGLGTVCIVWLHLSQAHAQDLSNKVTV